MLEKHPDAANGTRESLNGFGLKSLESEVLQVPYVVALEFSFSW